jgi:hypothetical protein
LLSLPAGYLCNTDVPLIFPVQQRKSRSAYIKMLEEFGIGGAIIVSVLAVFSWEQ